MKKIKIWIKYVLLKYNTRKIGFLNKILALRYGFSSDFFYSYNLNKNNIKDYIPEYKRVLSREIDGEYKFLLDDKIVSTDFFKQYVKIPNIVCIIRNNNFYIDGKRSDIETVKIELSNGMYVIKPISGGGGHGVHVITNENGNFCVDFVEQTDIKIEDFLSKYSDAIINPFVVQHSYSSEIYHKTVNTIRVVSIIDPLTDDVCIPFATHRFGTSKTGGVDNASSGGIFAMIDINSGVIGDAKKFNDNTLFEVHPDSKSKIKGVKIPNWDTILNEIKKVASKLSYIPFIAWDIVVTEEGFEVIELNPSCSLELFQVFGSIKESKLWDFYKHYGIVKK